jgi:hypothetical protein
MASLMIAIALYMFLLGSVVLESHAWGAAMGAVAICVFAGLWFGYPLLQVNCKK